MTFHGTQNRQFIPTGTNETARHHPLTLCTAGTLASESSQNYAQLLYRLGAGDRLTVRVEFQASDSGRRTLTRFGPVTSCGSVLVCDNYVQTLSDEGEYRMTVGGSRQSSCRLYVAGAVSVTAVAVED